MPFTHVHPLDVAQTPFDELTAAGRSQVPLAVRADLRPEIARDLAAAVTREALRFSLAGHGWRPPLMPEPSLAHPSAWTSSSTSDRMKNDRSGMIGCATPRSCKEAAHVGPTAATTIWLRARENASLAPRVLAAARESDRVDGSGHDLFEEVVHVLIFARWHVDVRRDGVDRRMLRMQELNQLVAGAFGVELKADAASGEVLVLQVAHDPVGGR